VWSLANIAGMRLSAFCDTHGLDHNQEIMNTIFNRTRDAAYHIIERKGATFYAVATGLMRIAEAIIRDQKTVLSISSYIEDYYGIEDVYMSLPTVVDRDGVNHVLRLELNPAEVDRLRKSSRVLKSNLSQLALGRK
jgi:L-lactate dehydrogenase